MSAARAAAVNATNVATGGEEQVENIAQEKLYVYQHVAVKMVQATAVLSPPVALARQLSVFLLPRASVLSSSG